MADVDLTALLQTELQGDWGLKACPKKAECLVCARMKNTPTLRSMRDLTLCGIDPNIISVAYGLPVQQILDHSQRQQWHVHQRQIGRTMLTTDVLTQLLLARMFASWKFASGSSADKALQMLLDVGGIGKKMSVEGQVNLSWEEMIHRDAYAKHEVTEDEVDEPALTVEPTRPSAPSEPILLPAPANHDPSERGH